MLYTIVPAEVIWEANEAPAELREVYRDGRLFQVEGGKDGSLRVVRLLSTDPVDYLDPHFQPGQWLT